MADGLPKQALDIDGNNVLGSDGYWLVGNNGSQSIPAYTNNWIKTGSIYGGNSGYYLVDNPALPGSTTNPGTTTTAPNTNVFSFQLTGTIPSDIRVGIMIDALDNAYYNPSSISILDNGVVQNTQATTAAIYQDRNPDWLFWDITGGRQGIRSPSRARRRAAR